MRAGTAIGALIREAEFAQSRTDFISKLSIALKESIPYAYLYTNFFILVFRFSLLVFHF